MEKSSSPSEKASTGSSGDLQDILEEIRTLKIDLQAVNTRRAFLEGQAGRPSTPPPTRLGFTTETNNPLPASTPGLQNFNSDVSAEYAAIKASVQSVRLPTELTLPTEAGNRQGVKKTDQPLCHVIVRSARYCETAMKVLTQCGATKTDSKFEEVFTILYAHIKYLQEEHASLIVQSTFDPTVSRFFRSLQRGSTFTPEALDHLRSAATIASVYRPSHSQQATRGRGGHFTRGPGDLYAQQAARGFPHSRGFRRDVSASDQQLSQSTCSATTTPAASRMNSLVAGGVRGD